MSCLCVRDGKHALRKREAVDLSLQDALKPPVTRSLGLTSPHFLGDAEPNVVATEVLKVPERVNVAVPPTGRSTDAAIGPLVGPAGHTAPPAAAHVHDSPVISGPGVSLTMTPATFDGPRLVATMVQATELPTTKEPV